MPEDKNLKPFARLISFASPHKSGFIKAIIYALLSVASGLLPYFAVAQMVIKLIDGYEDVKLYLYYSLFSALCFVMKALFAGLSTSTSHEATFAVMSEVRRSVAAKFARVPMGFIMETPSGQLKDSMVERVEQIEVPLAHVIPEMTANILIPLGIIVYMLMLDWRIALSTLMVFLIVVICYKLMIKEYPKRYGEVIQAGKHMSATTVEYINGIEVIKAFNQSALSYKKFSDAVNSNTKLVLSWMDSTLGYSAVMMSIMPAVLIGVLPIGLLCYGNGTLSASTFVVSILLSLGIMGPLSSAVFFTDDIAKINTVMGELGRVLDADEMIRPIEKVKLKNFDIQLNDICFSYDMKQVLYGINLSIKQGTVTALVGSSGSGKSTIAKLIASLWDVKGGSITIGGVDIRNIPTEQLTDLISYVSQDNYLFNDTVRNNIRIGMPKATDQQVEEIAKASGCHEFIMKLENGYETIVGGAGGHLSGGERQRIAIARAMIKNAPVVILDEATSYTDPENEAVIQEAVSRLTKGKTLIVIAHRLSTITDADQIAVISNGTVLDIGIHQQLLQNCKHYKAMWDAHISTKDEMGVK